MRAQPRCARMPAVVRVVPGVEQGLSRSLAAPWCGCGIWFFISKSVSNTVQRRGVSWLRIVKGSFKGCEIKRLLSCFYA